MDLKILVLLATLIIAGCTINPQDLAPPAKPGGLPPPVSTDTDGNNGSQQANITSQKLFTMEEVARHNTKDDCWMVIGNKILDLTSYVSHPGGDVYIPYCGNDATAGFNDKGGIGRNHSAYAFSLIGQYAIGEMGKPMPNGTVIPKNTTTPPIPPSNISAQPGNNTSNISAPSNITQPSGSTTMLTMEEVARHDKANDCWMVIYGKVLNLTAFASHPGGSTYAPYCGTDATQAFDNKGGRGNAHSSFAAAELALYTIGDLGQPQNRTVDTANITISGGDDDDEWEDD